MSPLAAAHSPAIAAPHVATHLRISSARLQNVLLWLTGASSGVVFIEPSPYEVMTLLTMVVFVMTGLTFRASLMPFALLLILLNIGYAISAVDLLDQTIILNWILTSCYMAITAIFFAAVMLANTEERLRFLLRGYVVAATIASAAAVLGYFRLIPSLSDTLLLYDRARGTFKDPNVLGPFLVLPALIVLQNVVTGRFWSAARSSILFALYAIAIFLAFSRGAWGLLAFSAAMMLAIMFATTHSSNQRARIVLMTVAIIAAAALAVVALLSLDIVADLFKQRASLSQSYDVGETGRFGRHVQGALLALDKPLGIGPRQFETIFPEATHNSFLNAFMSGGWLAGVCYPALIVLTLVFGFRPMFMPTPWRTAYIAIYSTYVGTAIESMIIDTDHWRHFFLLFGLVWGLVITSHHWMDGSGAGGGRRRAATLASAGPAK